MTTSRAPTLADVLAAVSVMDLPGTAVRDMTSALRKVGTVLGRSLAEIPADPSKLGPRLEGIAPSAHGISQQRWQREKSDPQLQLDAQ